ncbi:hypothetical protein M9Y10_029176 [Tritrichomonas musculus]|uniref:BAR domain-containing protein n=1 Tax=Tritrichomonas musculus TaxID=1915356 RepID=A0ABR2KLE2_9EUKA
MKKLFQKISGEKGFKEFNDFVGSLNTIKNSEVLMIDSLYRAYSSNLQNYANSEPSGISECLNAVFECGTKIRNIQKEVFEKLSNLSNDVGELQKQENEISKWRSVCKQAQEQSEKSFTAYKKAEENNKRAKITQKPAEISKTEATLAAAKRKYDDDLNSAKDQKQSLEEKEKPYRGKFLESYVTPISAALNLRAEEAENLSAASGDILTAVEKLHEVETTGSIEKLREELEEFNKIQIE